jgi:hypothetical protein
VRGTARELLRAAVLDSGAHRRGALAPPPVSDAAAHLIAWTTRPGVSRCTVLPDYLMETGHPGAARFACPISGSSCHQRALARNAPMTTTANMSADPSAYDLSDAIRAAVMACPLVESVELVGSRMPPAPDPLDPSQLGIAGRDGYEALGGSDLMA